MAEVNVKYAFGVINLVEVEILVAKNRESAEPRAMLTPALPSLPHGVYQVAWKLVAGEGASGPEFKEEEGIYIKESPPKVLVTGSQRRKDDPRFWDASIETHVTGANGVSYGIRGSVELEMDGSRIVVDFTRTDFDVDPTIAVTPDPPPGRLAAASP